MNETIKALIINNYRLFSDNSLTPQEQYDNLVFILESSGLEYDIQQSGIYIKYPDTPCVDVYGNSTMIRDLYINLTWNGTIRFRRFTFTEYEERANYIHSHLSGSTNQWTTTYCFGNSVTFNTSQHLDVKLVTLIGLLPLFVNTESTNHSPYQRISNLYSFVDMVQKSTNMVLDQKYLKLFNDNLTIRLVKKEFLDIVIDIPEFLLDQYCTENEKYSYHYNGCWYKNKLSPRLTQESRSSTDFVFKGQPIDYVLIPVKEVDIQPQICGQTKENIKSYYEHKLKSSTSFWEEGTAIINRNGA